MVAWAVGMGQRHTCWSWLRTVIHNKALSSLLEVGLFDDIGFTFGKVTWLMNSLDQCNSNVKVFQMETVYVQNVRLHENKG